MATMFRSSTLNKSASNSIDLTPLVVVVMLALLFAGSIWAAGTSKPTIDPVVAASQGGL